MRALVTAEFPEPGLAELRELGFDAVTAGWGLTRQALGRDELVAALEGAAVLICEVETVDAAVLAATPSLRLVASCRGDPTNVDLDAAAEHGVIVLRTPARNAISVADFTMALLLSQARGVARAGEHLRTRGWLVDGQLPYFHFRGPELSGRTIGLIGLGAIGRLVAERAAGFGMSIIAYDPYVSDPPPGVRMTDLDDLLRRAHVVSIHCPLTPETRGLLEASRLALMRPDALLVNTAKAAVVDEEALIEALRGGRIGGAALDVFWHEPIPADHPLLGLANVTLTPHVAGASDDVPGHHARMVLDDIARWQRGEALVHEATPPARRPPPRPEGAP